MENNNIATPHTDRAEKIECVILRLISVAFLVGGFFALYLSIILSVVMWIITIISWQSGNVDKYMKTVPGFVLIGRLPGRSIRNIRDELVKHTGQFGKPYVSSVVFMPGKCIIYGPDGSGRYMYIHRSLWTRRLYAVQNGMPGLINMPKDVSKNTEELGIAYDHRFTMIQDYFDSLEGSPETGSFRAFCDFMRGYVKITRESDYNEKHKK